MPRDIRTCAATGSNLSNLPSFFLCHFVHLSSRINLVRILSGIFVASRRPRINPSDSILTPASPRIYSLPSLSLFFGRLLPFPSISTVKDDIWRPVEIQRRGLFGTGKDYHNLVYHRRSDSLLSGLQRFIKQDTLASTSLDFR